MARQPQCVCTNVRGLSNGERSRSHQPGKKLYSDHELYPSPSTWILPTFGGRRKHAASDAFPTGIVFFAAQHRNYPSELLPISKITGECIFHQFENLAGRPVSVSHTFSSPCTGRNGDCREQVRPYTIPTPDIISCIRFDRSFLQTTRTLS
jgi:hypothetical protein